MNFESKEIKKNYESNIAKKYNFSLLPKISSWKKKTLSDSSLKRGNKVLVFCCGTGMDFPYILNRIGKEGKIIGVDFSSEMLKNAHERIKKEKWSNIELIEADVTKFKGKLAKDFDTAVCTLGMSVIPEYKSAYYNLISYVKTHGEIIIADVQLIPGWLAHLNFIPVVLTKKYGGTYEGYQNTIELCSIMKNELTDVIKKDLFFKSYFYCIGKVK
jgi:ubiquinone/menaquinone biosynthesis C-methylase UbiE